MSALEERADRRNERREFFRMAFGAAAITGAGLAGIGYASRAAAADVSDVDILNLALNLEYLEAQFYSYAAYGKGLDTALLGGTGTAGSATGGKQVTFTDPVVQAYAREIAQDEVAHVTFLRSALGSSAVAQPSIDISSDPAGVFLQRRSRRRADRPPARASIPMPATRISCSPPSSSRMSASPPIRAQRR
jgi:hypothetical protein